MYLSGLVCIPVLVVNQDLGKVVLSIYGSDISNLKVGAENTQLTTNGTGVNLEGI